MTDAEKAISRATDIYRSYRRSGGGWGSYEEQTADMLADIMHYVDSLITDREIGETFDQLLDTARMHYEAEKNGE